MIGADGLFLTKISESEGFLELQELRSNGAIRKYQFIKKEENIHKAAVKTAALLRVWGIK